MGNSQEVSQVSVDVKIVRADDERVVLHIAGGVVDVLDTVLALVGATKEAWSNA